MPFQDSRQLVPVGHIVQTDGSLHVPNDEALFILIKDKGCNLFFVLVDDLDVPCQGIPHFEFVAGDRVDLEPFLGEFARSSDAVIAVYWVVCFIIIEHLDGLPHHA